MESHLWSQPNTYTECKYGGPFGRCPGRVEWKRGLSGFDVCFDNAFISRKVLLPCQFGPFVSPSLRVFEFLNATATECNLPQQRKCSFFQAVSSFTSEEKPKSETEARSSPLLKELLKFRLESILENVSVIAFSSKLLSFDSMLFTGFRDKAVEVHLLGYCTVVFASCDSVQVDANANKYFFLWDRISFEKSSSLTWGGYWPWKLCWNTTRHHISSSFKQFFWDLQSWNLNKL